MTERSQPNALAAVEPHPRLSMVTLAWVFFRIGAMAFGETELVMIERELVDRRKVLTHQDLTDALTYTKPLPGSTVVQIVAYLAYRLRGWPGSAVATAIYLTPSTLAMVALAAGYLAFSGLPLLRPAVEGLTAAAVGLLLATAWRLGKRAVDPRQPLSVVLALGAIVAGGIFGISAALLVVVAGLIGIVAYTLSLVERTVVADTGWLTPADLSTALAFAFMTPGPVLVLAPFVGYHVAGLGGALAAALGVFLIPWFLATGSASILRSATQRPWVRAFGRGAAPTVVALLVVSAFNIGRAGFAGWPTVLIAGAALVATTRRAHPLLVLIGGAAVGMLLKLVAV